MATESHIAPAFQPGKHIRLQNKLTGQFVTAAGSDLHANGSASDVGTEFVVHKAGKGGNKFMLQPVSDEAAFIGIHGAHVSAAGRGGATCMLTFVKHDEDGTVSLKFSKAAKHVEAADKFFLGFGDDGKARPPTDCGAGDAGRFVVMIVEERSTHGAAAASLSDGVHVRLMSMASGKYLAVNADSGAVSATGGGPGMATEWVCHGAGKRLAKVKLAIAGDSHFLRVTASHATDARGTGGPHCVLRVCNLDEGFIALGGKLHKRKDAPNSNFMGFNPDGTAMNSGDVKAEDAAACLKVEVVGHRHSKKK